MCIGSEFASMLEVPFLDALKCIAYGLAWIQRSALDCLANDLVIGFILGHVVKQRYLECA